MTLKQVLYRTRAVVRRRWWKVRRQGAPRGPADISFHAPFLYEGGRSASIPDHLTVLANDAVQRAKSMAEGRFTFLNQEVSYKNRIEWNDPGVSQLWRYHLHYFGYVEDLILLSMAGEPERAWRTFQSLASSWIFGNGFLRGDGWHPYTVSLRIVNWINALAYWEKQFSETPQFREQFLSSLYGQARFVAGNLEKDVRGNHLLENVRALLWAGVAFSGKEASGWRQTALGLLRTELVEQVLSDGGHFERAPGYHGTILKDCLEMGVYLKRSGKEVPHWLDDAIFRMLQFLKAILPPDGQYPLFKDTAWDAAPLPLDLLCAGALYFHSEDFKVSQDMGLYPWLVFGSPGMRAFHDLYLSDPPKGSQSLAESGFFVFRDDPARDCLVFDAGKPCPDYLPAHAHADMFSYEWMKGGRRVVVDSGVYTYAPGKWRDFFRSTRAHNTVEIESRNQSEVWNSFRVARRARPGPVHCQASETGAVLDVSHDGYVRQGVQAVHRRVLWWEKGWFFLFFDEILGSGRIRARSFVHLHPGLGFHPTGDRSFQILGDLDAPLGLEAFGHERDHMSEGQENREIQGWYSKAFGKKVPNPVLCLEKEGALPFCFGYLLHEAEPVRVNLVQRDERHYTIDVTIRGRAFSLNIAPDRVSI